MMFMVWGHQRVVLREVASVEPGVGVFPGSVDDEPAEDTLRDEVENGVGDSLASDAKLVGALSKDPDDGVEEPSENGEVGDNVVVVEKPDVWQVGGVRAPDAGQEQASSAVVHTVVDGCVAETADVVKDGDEGENGEAVEDPLLATVDGGGNEAGRNHEDVREEEEVPDLVG